jgi:hypothetical protein
MKHFIRIWQGVEHKVLGSKNDTKICHGCKIEFNQKNFQIASPKTDRKTQVIYKRLKNKCKNCENPLRNVRNNLEKHPKTPPKKDYCEHCGRGNTKIVLHHNHLTGKFVRWACVNCNSRFVHDTLEEHIKDAERWYQE